MQAKLLIVWSLLNFACLILVLFCVLCTVARNKSYHYRYRCRRRRRRRLCRRLCRRRRRRRPPRRRRRRRRRRYRYHGLEKRS